MQDLKKYDKKLYTKKKLDGTLEIIRNSQFIKNKEYIVLSITNQFIGSGRFILDKLMSMDSRRFDFVKDAAEKNLAIRNRKIDNRQHRDVADFITNGNKIII